VSLHIEPTDVRAVLLADGWHEVEPESFYLDSYEYVYEDDHGELDIAHGGGQSGVCATGFAFKSPEQLRTCGPLTAILAVRC
jgi:hypothetical protein